MQQAVDLVSSIGIKVRKLRVQQERLQKMVDEQEKEIARLSQLTDEQRTEIQSLKDKIKQVKIAKLAETKEGVADAKGKISELVREIDKCIGLLST
jgi:hypothetical protein